MPQHDSDWRRPLLTDQESIFAETVFNEDECSTKRVSLPSNNIQNGASVSIKTPLFSSSFSPLSRQPVSSSRGRQRSGNYLLKALICVAVAGLLIWTARRLYASYVTSWHITVVEEHFHKDVLGGSRTSEEMQEQTEAPKCNIANENHRFDCYPGPGATEKTCAKRGCCWKPLSHDWQSGSNRTGDHVSIGVPYCFFPTNYRSYEVSGIRMTAYGFRVTLHSFHRTKFWPSNIKNLTLDIFMETKTRLHFKITDSSAARYEVPIDTPRPAGKVAHADYIFRIQNSPFGFSVKRRSTGTVIFDSTVAPLLYGDQFLQLSTVLPSGFVYGIGERYKSFVRNASSWQQLSLWARDEPPALDRNLYGFHPFLTSLEKDGNAYGIFLLNSNAMDVVLQPYPALTFRTIGGVLDFYVFLGPKPGAVLQQYMAVIGRPGLPPYWALGFHLCRWGYGSTARLRAVVDRMRNASFPYDAQWMDIDYMDSNLDWTYDKQAYAGLPELVGDLHSHDQHFVIIVDSGISTEHAGKYPPYDSGVKEKVFINDYRGHPLVGQVWPGYTVFPDFTSPRVDPWWFNCAKAFHDEIPFDGIWTDMNEPSNFVIGSTKGCSTNHLDVPPYTPGIEGGQLAVKTICPSAQQHIGFHYNVHNLYGHSEACVTHRMLKKLRGKRSLVISRSTFPSTGRYAGHWTGDNNASWEHLYYSIPEILNFQLFGVPLVGADVCGFNGEPSEELCTRWIQLAAFYPFMRSHNKIKDKDQDPAAFSPTAQARMRSVLVLRYSLLPYLYTLFYNAHTLGSAVVNPLSFIYPNDTVTYNIDRQFMWGDELLISPVLTQGATSVTAYMPRDTWYAFNTGELLPTSGVHVTLAAPMDTINVHIRGGSIIPRQAPLNETTTVRARKNPFELLVALDSNGKAGGNFYWDDGETLDTTDLFNLLKIDVKSGRLVCQTVRVRYVPKGGMWLNTVTIMGVRSKPGRVTVKDIPVNFTWNASTKVLLVKGLLVELLNWWDLKWVTS